MQQYIIIHIFNPQDLSISYGFQNKSLLNVNSNIKTVCINRSTPNFLVELTKDSIHIENP